MEAAPPVALVDVFAAELGRHLGAEEVSFLISDFNGSALVRLSHEPLGEAKSARRVATSSRSARHAQPLRHLRQELPSAVQAAGVNAASARATGNVRPTRTTTSQSPWAHSV